MSFGFSIGDFISAFQLVGTVINALKESGGSGSEYRELVNELYTLEVALLQVKQLELEEEQRSEYIALRQAAAQCQQTIDAFLVKTLKYQKHLRKGGSESRLKDGWMQIRWAMCRSEDVSRFKNDIAAHTQSIQILLSSLHMNRLTVQAQKHDRQYRSLGATIQDATNQCMNKLLVMTSALSSGALQGLQILENTAKILRTNILIFQMVCTIQNIITRIPNQIDRQQPVYMIDALGRAAPFYLEFIRSSEALKAVLKINFENVPSGARKIDSHDFMIQDAATKRPIDLSRDWDTCFLPGQRVEMSMVFQWRTRSINSCPNCKCSCQTSANTDTECPRCGVSFTRLVIIEDPSEDTKREPRKTTIKHHALAIEHGLKARQTATVSKPPITAYDEAEDMKHYRRIKLLHRQQRPVWKRLAAVQVAPSSDTTLQLRGAAEAEAGAEAEAEANNLRDSEPSPSSYYDIGADDQFDFGDSIDRETFDQILEMDEDDEREFSRSMVENDLEMVDNTMPKLYLAIESLSFGEVRGINHFLKGWARSLGLQNLGDIFQQLQDYEPPSGQTDAETIADLTARADVAQAEYDKAKKVLKRFYKLGE